MSTSGTGTHVIQQASGVVGLEAPPRTRRESSRQVTDSLVAVASMRGALPASVGPSKVGSPNRSPARSTSVVFGSLRETGPPLALVGILTPAAAAVAAPAPAPAPEPAPAPNPLPLSGPEVTSLPAGVEVPVMRELEFPSSSESECDLCTLCNRVGRRCVGCCLGTCSVPAAAVLRATLDRVCWR